MSDYGPWILLVRMWTCISCKTMWAGGSHQCGYCMTPKNPDTFLL